MRLRVIAENKNLLVVNGAELGKYDRKDAEIYYLRHSFEEYFKVSNTPYYDYDIE